MMLNISITTRFPDMTILIIVNDNKALNKKITVTMKKFVVLVFVKGLLTPSIIKVYC